MSAVVYFSGAQVRRLNAGRSIQNIEGLRFPEALHDMNSGVSLTLYVLHVPIQLELELVHPNVLVLFDVHQTHGG